MILTTIWKCDEKKGKKQRSLASSKLLVHKTVNIDFLYETKLIIFNAYSKNSLHSRFLSSELSGRSESLGHEKKQITQQNSWSYHWIFAKIMICLGRLSAVHDIPGTWRPWHGCAWSCLALPWSCHGQWRAYLRFARIIASLPRLRLPAHMFPW